MSIQIALTPTASHCIETVAKREYWKHVTIYLKKEQRIKGSKKNRAS